MTLNVGYSGTPLAKKLGIRSGSRVLLIDAPEAYLQWLAPLPDAVEFVRRAGAGVDVAHVFATERSRLAKRLPDLRQRLDADAAIWVSWPKRTAGMASTVDGDAIRALAFPLGLVDIKVCAVSEVWSALKLVRRKALR